MYNEYRKEQFIQEHIYCEDGTRRRSEATEKMLRRVFKDTEPIEEKYQCDFAEMSTAHMQEAYDEAAGFRSQSKEIAYYFLKQYVDWCIRKGLIFANAFKSLRTDSISKTRDGMIASPSHLKRCLDIVFPSLTENDIDYIYRTNLWLAYMGVLKSDASKICRNDVDFVTMQIKSQMFFEPIQIYGEAVTDLYKACTITYFTERRGGGHPRTEGNQILRGKMTAKSLDEFMNTTMAQCISRKFLEAEKRRAAANDPDEKVKYENISLSLTYDKIRYSGIYYRAYENERIGFDPESYLAKVVEEELDRKIEAGISKLSKSRTKAMLRADLMGAYRKDYALWKKAFVK